MHTKRAVVTAGLAFLGPLLIAAIVLRPLIDKFVSGDATIGEAAPLSNSRIDLPKLSNGKILPAKHWPSACSLVTEYDVKAILPQAQEITSETRSARDQSIREFAADPEWREGNYAASAQCLYQMRLPGETYRATQLWVRIEAIADSSLIRRYYDRVSPSSLAPNQGAAGAEACVITGLYEGTWQCISGSIMFSVGGQTTATFKGKPAPAPLFWRDAVNPKIVQNITAKLA